MIRWINLLGSAAIGALIAAPAVAQDAAAAASAPPAQASQSQVQEIVVTAQRHAERLQDVPISVSAVSGAQLASKGISGIETLSSAVPSLDVGQVGTIGTPYLRGIGANTANPNDEPSVAMYVDGVYIAAPFANLLSFNNVDRIEVLKGPQGTLFGRNATGGVIQVITRDPSQQTKVEASMGYGNYQTTQADFYATTGLAPNLAMDVAAQYHDQAKGWGHNIVTGTETYKSRDFSGRSKLLFTPGDNTRITVSGDYAYLHSGIPEYQIAPPSEGSDGKSHLPGRYDTEDDTPTRVETRQWGVSGKIEQDLGFARAVSITARRVAKGHYGPFDSDGTPVDFVHADLRQTNSEFTQELQLMSPSRSKIDWLIGAFYFNDNAAYSPGHIAGSSPAAFEEDVYGRQKTRSWAVYAQTTVPITDTTKITGGIRYTHENQRFISSVAVGGQDFPSPTLHQGFNKATWRVAINQKLSSDISVYASYNRGVKTGGYNLLSPGAPGYAPEELDAYEVGFKSELFDRHVRFNIAAFYYDYKDIQVEIIRPPQILLQNAARAHIKGVDADLQIVPFRGLTITAGAGYLDGKYADYPDPAVYPPSPFDPPIPLANAKGKRTVRTPKFTGNVGATYSMPVSFGSLSLSGNVSYNDGYYYDVANLFPQKSYTLVNASVGWTNRSGEFGITAWAKNLSDSRYLLSGAPSSSGYLQVPAAPRTYGMSLNAKF